MLTISDLVVEYQKLKKELDKCLVDHQSLLDENRYLKQKVKEYRHKTWFPVYEENLKLQLLTEAITLSLVEIADLILIPFLISLVPQQRPLMQQE